MGVSGYTLFVKLNRAKVKEENPELDFNDIARKVSQMWQNLSREEQNYYNNEAAKYNEEHKNDPKKEKKPNLKTLDEILNDEETFDKMVIEDWYKVLDRSNITPKQFITLCADLPYNFNKVELLKIFGHAKVDKYANEQEMFDVMQALSTMFNLPVLDHPQDRIQH